MPSDVLLIAPSLGRSELALWFAGVCAAASVAGGMTGHGSGVYGGRPLPKRLFRADPGWLSIAFVILLIPGFWVAGKGARRAADEGG